MDYFGKISARAKQACPQGLDVMKHKPFSKSAPARVRRQTRRAVRNLKSSWLNG